MTLLDLRGPVVSFSASQTDAEAEPEEYAAIVEQACGQRQAIADLCAHVPQPQTQKALGTGGEQKGISRPGRVDEARVVDERVIVASKVLRAVLEPASEARPQRERPQAEVVANMG